MATSFSMDTIGFLQAINKLERRFEELVSPETMRKVCEDYDRDGTPTPWDHRLYELARDVFACGSWTTAPLSPRCASKWPKTLPRSRYWTKKHEQHRCPYRCLYRCQSACLVRVKQIP